MYVVDSREYNPTKSGPFSVLLLQRFAKCGDAFEEVLVPLNCTNTHVVYKSGMIYEGKKRALIASCAYIYRIKQ